MDQKLLREREAKCIQECQPGCSAACPVHVDVKGMIKAIRAGDYAEGYDLLNRRVPFPRIISSICDQPCQKDCIRGEIDAPISVNALENICVKYHVKSTVKAPLLSPRNEKVAIVGAGLSGLTVAYELAIKGYKVVVFEKSGKIGGQVRVFSGKTLPEMFIESDFSVFDALRVEFQRKSPVGQAGESGISLARLCEEFDAVYLGVGSLKALPAGNMFDLDADGAVVTDSLTLNTTHPKIFAGGSLRRDKLQYSPITSISDGKIAANSIDRLLQKVSLSANRANEGPFESCLYTNTSKVLPEKPVEAADAETGYSQEEAAQEANRCLICECLECVKDCEFLAHYGAYPKRYVREIYNNLSIVMGMHHANKMINSCSLCGLCKEVCPNDLHIGEICLEARQMMVKKGKMPPSTHDFALRDMQFNNSDKFALARHQPGYSVSSVVFYPGCQLAASTPQHVKLVYDYLCSSLAGGVGMMLGCCGAPAFWAGQEEKFQQTLQQTKDAWVNLGSPSIITACPTCYAMFSKYLPEVSIESLWVLLDKLELPDSGNALLKPQKLAVHDSCSTRHEKNMQASVRNIMLKLGYEVEELPRNRDHTTCCGYGGLMIFANKEIASKEITRRAGESATDYLTYCSMCRDNFASIGKNAYHLLDLVFGDRQTLKVQPSPGYSERQKNRQNLKLALLREVWGENMAERHADVKLVIPDRVKEVMEERLILESDIAKVIAHAESSGNKMKSVDRGCFIAYHKLNSVTYWVEYTAADDGYLVQNAYSHRIEILE